MHVTNITRFDWSVVVLASIGYRIIGTEH